MLFRGKKGGLQTGSASVNHEPKAQSQRKDLNDSWKLVTLANLGFPGSSLQNYHGNLAINSTIENTIVLLL